MKFQLAIAPFPAAESFDEGQHLFDAVRSQRIPDRGQ
jgi:hypothetical protein